MRWKGHETHMVERCSYRVLVG